MKRYLVPGLLSLGLVLTGCSGTVGGQATQAQESSSAPETTQTTTPTTQASPSSSEPVPTTTQQVPQGAYSQAQALSDLRELTSSFDSSSDADVFMLFDNICANLDAGNTIHYVVTTGVDAGILPYDVGAAVSAAVLSTCPEYVPLVEAYIDSGGQ